MYQLFMVVREDVFSAFKLQVLEQLGCCVVHEAWDTVRSR